jgi:hypothetical protein
MHSHQVARVLLFLFLLAALLMRGVAQYLKASVAAYCLEQDNPYRLTERQLP